MLNSFITLHRRAPILRVLIGLFMNVLQDNDLQTETNPFDIFKVRPLLKLKLSWSQEPTNGLVNRPKLYQQSEFNGMKKESNKEKNAQKFSDNKNGK